MKQRVNKSILKVKPYVPGKPIEEVQRELGLKQVVKLASNENPYGPSPKVLQAINAAARQINRYPDGGCYALRQLLAKRLSVKPEQLIFGNGSDELIVMAIRAFVAKGEEVVIAKPSFLVYDIASRVVGAKIKAIPLKSFKYDLDRMRKAITRKTKIVFIGNPDNPAGTYVTQKELKAFLKSVRKDVLVFIDEAYFEYVRKKDYPDAINMIKQHKNVVVSRTFSKMYGLAGLRIGYAIAHREVVDLLNRVREPFNVNSIAQAAAIAVLKDRKYYNDVAKKIERQRQYLYSQLESMGVAFYQSFTNFIMINVKKDAKVITKKLLKKGVIVRDMNFWGMKTFIRISIGTQAENRKLITTLKGVL